MDDKTPDLHNSVKSYVSSLARLEDAVAEVEIRSWHALQQEVDKAVTFEQEAARLTAEEAALLKTYIKRDVKSLLAFVKESGKGLKEWLSIDMGALELGLRRSLLAIADHTLVERQQLDHQLHHDEGTYVAGETVMPGMLQCAECSKMVCLVEVAQLAPCHGCDCIYFRRITSRDT
jgi:hypothetical protein